MKPAPRPRPTLAAALLLATTLSVPFVAALLIEMLL